MSVSSASFLQSNRGRGDQDDDSSRLEDGYRHRDGGLGAALTANGARSPSPPDAVLGPVGCVAVACTGAWWCQGDAECGRGRSAVKSAWPGAGAGWKCERECEPVLGREYIDINANPATATTTTVANNKTDTTEENGTKGWFADPFSIPAVGVTTPTISNSGSNSRSGSMLRSGLSQSSGGGEERDLIGSFLDYPIQVGCSSNYEGALYRYSWSVVSTAF
ncbi:hypothetical protein BD410DRAFT_548223 [Rickenella mellea]|uniref:Uncharacterized protein n=1 Tax=Rickenella mellea TaxID=50990 RepID=A0A4Y7PPU6_9AGAM|nr:hypothetical protein BD410DRAFT_548223 [Rickenella mellea]